MDSSTLRDDLYLLAHDDAGKPLAHRTTLSIGLASALLADLALAGRIDLIDGRVVVSDPGPVGEQFADRAVQAVLSLRNRHTPQTWIGWLAEDAYERVRGALLASGTLNRTTVRRLGLIPTTRFRPTNQEAMVLAHARARYAVLGLEQPDARTAALCALLAVLRLESSVYVNAPTTEVHDRLTQIAAANHPTIQQLIAAADTAAASASVALYR